MELLDAKNVTVADSGWKRHEGIAAGASVTETYSADIPEVKSWTAESPNLYTLLVSVKNAAGEVVSVDRQQVGFRKVDIGADGQFLVNGKEVIFKGVNRHETHPDHGRAVPFSVMEKDVKLIRNGSSSEHDLNAIVRDSRLDPKLQPGDQIIVPESGRKL